MGKDPAFPMYANDWLSSSNIAQMTAEEERGYLRLLCHCWASGDCSLEDSNAALGALSLLGEGYFNNPSQIVRRCLAEHPSKSGYLTNERLFEVWKERQEWREKCRLGGVNSGKARRSGKNDGSKGTSNSVQSKREVDGNSSFTSSSSSKTKLNPLSSSSTDEKEAALLKRETKFIEKWNALEGVLPNSRPTLSKKRRGMFRARLKEDGWAADCVKAFEHFPLKQWHEQNGWKPTVEFMLRGDVAMKISDGEYDRPLDGEETPEPLDIAGALERGRAESDE